MCRFITLAIILGLGSVSKADPKCHLNELMRCEEIAEEGFNSLPKRSIPHTEEQMAQVCDKVQKSTDCAQDYRDRCMTPIQKEMLEYLLEGMIEGQKEVCTPDSDIHKKYMEHAGCLNKVSQMDEVKTEMEYVLAVMEKGETVAPNKRIVYSCCAYVQTYNFFLTLGRDTCGKDATDTIEEIISMGFAQLPEVFCNGFDANDDRCKGVLPPEGAKPSGEIDSPVLNTLKEKFKNWLE